MTSGLQRPSYFPVLPISCIQGKGLGSGHKTLLYGNAILLRHCNSDMVSVHLEAFLKY